MISFVYYLDYVENLGQFVHITMYDNETWLANFPLLNSEICQSCIGKVLSYARYCPLGIE